MMNKGVGSMKQSLTGTVKKIKIIRAENPTMAYVKLHLDSQQEISAIIAKNTLTFMLDVQIEDIIHVYGHFNDRQQFIIEKYLNSNKIHNHHLNLPKHLAYPHKKESHK